jgi:tripartite-type tricarboxylate transporter receptor subunit TctC
MKFRIPLLGLAACCLALTSVRGPAVAQDYPTRAIRVIGGSAPGGISDVFMRLINDELQKRLGQPVIMENRPGGTFNIAARACADAQPDGYTICILPNEPFSYNPHLFKTLGYDPEKIEPITNAFFITQILAVNPSLNAKNLEQLAAVSKAKAGTLSYSSPSVALVLFMETFKQETGADIVRVPFKGGGDTVYGLVSGTTPVAFVGVGNLVSQLREGVVLGLAVESAQRSPLFPDVPTLTELGYKGDTTRAYFGLFAPPGTPKPIIRKLRDEIAKIAGEQAFKDKNLIQRGLEPVLDSPEEFAAFLRKDREIAGRIVKASGMTPQ